MNLKKQAGSTREKLTETLIINLLLLEFNVRNIMTNIFYLEPIIQFFARLHSETKTYCNSDNESVAVFVSWVIPRGRVEGYLKSKRSRILKKSYTIRDVASKSSCSSSTEVKKCTREDFALVHLVQV